MPENRGYPEVRQVLKLMKNDFNRFKILGSKSRKRALDSDERVAKRTIEYFRKKNKCSVYKINQKVLVRYGGKGKKASKRPHVCIGKIEKVGKYDMYKVGYRDLVNNQKVSSWFSVEDTADLQVQRGFNNENGKKKIHERLREIVKQSEDQFDKQDYYISFYPLLDGNCQFSSICRILKEFGFQRSPEALRTDIISDLEANPNDPSGTPLDFYIDVPFSNYSIRMSIDRTFGDGITLRAAAELLNIEFVIISTLGRAAEVTITPQNFSPQGRVYLGHFAENHGELYVVLNTVEDPDVSNESFDSEVKKLPINRSLTPSKILINQMNLSISKWKKIPINRLAICHLN